jgi:hypothetical protein
MLRATLLALLLALILPVTAQETNVKPRIIITADPELDDNNSLIRLLLYSSDLKIEGLIYACLLYTSDAADDM